MRKILTLILVLALTAVLFAGCAFPGQNDGEHVHSFVEGKCECGESDPNYVPAPEVDELLQSASDYIRQMYKDDPEVTAEDYKLIGLVSVGDVVFEVVWTTDSDEILVTVNENGEVTIDVPDESAKEIPYVLTATITNDKGETVQRTFNRKVPKFAVNSFEEYMAAVKDDSVIIQGIVVAINSKAAGNTRNHLFILDESGKGGYYSYQMDEDPVADLGIELGMTVRVSGPVVPHNGMQEIKGGVAKIVDSTIKSFEYIDITDKFVEGANFNELVALPVIIKGVTLGRQELDVSTSQYLYFTLNGVESYVRTYVTDFPTTLAQDKKAEIDALHAANYGNVADVYGILITYSGTPYIIPTAVDCFNNIQIPERTDAEKIELELGALSMGSKFTSDTVLDLVLSGVAYDAVKFAWASDSQYAVVADGKLTITVPDDETVVTLTVTATCGDATATKEIKITLSKSITSISDALAIGGAKDHNTYTPDKYLVAGIIKEVYNAQYGNMYLVDAEGNQITIYGTYSADGSLRYDAMENAPKAGDYVVILGVLGQYNGTAQMKNGWIVSVADSLTVPEANQTGASQEHNTYTPDKYIVTGTVTEIANSTYGNLYIKDAEGNTLYIYGLYDATGKVRFDSMTTQPKVGDTIIVYSAVGQYNGTVQLKNAWLVGLTKGEPDNGGSEGGETPDTPPVADGIVTAPQVGVAYKFGFLQAGLNLQLYFNGTISSENTPWYFATTENFSDAVDVYLEAVDGVDGGYRLYFYVGEVKTYVVAYPRDDDPTKGTLKLDTAVPETYFTFNTEYNTLVYAFTTGEQFYLGTYGTYKTVSCSAWSNITSSYPAHLYVANASGGDNGGSEGGETPNTPAPEVPEGGVYTIPEVLASAAGTAVIVKGTVVEIYQVWNPQYNNVSFYIADADGNRLLVFRTGTDAKIGDQVTVTGTTALYNDVIQIAQGSTTVIDVAHVCSDFEAADCLNAAVCKVCKAVNGVALGHNYVNGACDRCGATESTNTITASKTIASLITELGWDSTTTKQSFTLDGVVSVKINGGANTGKAYDGNNIRIYATDNPAGTITITVPDGYELVSIKISAQNGTYANLCVDGTDTDIKNATVSVSGSSVVLNSVKFGDEGKQVRVTAIEVVYKAV